MCLVWQVLLTIDVREGVSLGVRDLQLLHSERIIHAHEIFAYTGIKMLLNRTAMALSNQIPILGPLDS